MQTNIYYLFYILLLLFIIYNFLFKYQNLLKHQQVVQILHSIPRLIIHLMYDYLDDKTIFYAPYQSHNA